MVFFAAGIILLLTYASLIFFYTYWWRRVSVYLPYASFIPEAKLSVVVAARNEEKNIGALLTALSAQTYPPHLFEVLVVDDHSTDATAAIVAAWRGNCRLVSLPRNVFSKKKAIEMGVQEATGALIVTTDADCVPPPQWLMTIAAFYREKGAAFIAAPVRYIHANNLLGIFQTVDFLTLQGITAAGVASDFHSMCNGANLAYTKEAFTAVDGFAGIDAVASGDDLLLMHKIWKRYPQRVHYLKSSHAVVQTTPMPTWKAFFWQRIRWASKTTYYDDKRIFCSLLLVYGVNLFFVLLLLAGFWDMQLWIAAIIFCIIKTLTETPFVYAVAHFYEQQKLMRYFFFLQPLHMFYTVIIGLVSQLGSYQWKGRRTK